MPARQKSRARMLDTQGNGTRHTTWNADELSRIIVSSRFQKIDVAGIRPDRWWPAFLLTTLDCGLLPQEIFALPVTAFHPHEATLSIGSVVFGLHQLTVEALHILSPQKRSLLLPWDRDESMLYRRFREILYAARLPHTSPRYPLVKLMQSGEFRTVLEQIDPYRPFQPRQHAPIFRRKRDQTRKSRSTTNFKKPKFEYPNNFSVTDAESLVVFFDEVYSKIRLDGNENTLKMYHCTLHVFSTYLGHIPRLADLNDDTLEGFAIWLSDQGLTNATLNKHLRNLLALWRFAWKKRRIDEAPRDVTFRRQNKRINRAWTVAEIGKIIAQSKSSCEFIGGVDAADWWPAFLLTLYYTGLRMNAALSLETASLCLETGWLTVPAEVQKQRADQLFELPPDALQAILKTDPKSREMLFPVEWSSHYHCLAKRLRTFLIAAGLPHTKRDLFHKFRRTSATLVCMALDENAAKQHLGHADITTTRGYIDPTMVKQTQATRLIPQPKLEDVS